MSANDGNIALTKALRARYGSGLSNGRAMDWPCPICDNHPRSTVCVPPPGVSTDASCCECGETTRALLAALGSPDGPERAKARDRIVSVRAADVTPANVRWAWRGWLPLGMYSTLVGMPGFGKTTLATYIAARFTRGELDGALAGQPSTVLFISYEDVVEVRLRPLAEAHGADLDRLVFLKAATVGDVIDLTSQLEEIETKVVAHGARMLIIDPLVAGLPNGKVDSHRDQSVRSVLAPLMALAEQRDIALLTTGHFSKGAMSALMGSGGSIGFVGAPRSILAFGPDPRPDAAPHARVLAHAKSNVGRLQGSRDVSVIARFISDGIETSCAVMGDECDVSADDLVQVNHREESPVVRAEKFLRDLLADGPHRAQEVHDLAQDGGIAVRTLNRAKRDLGVDSARGLDGDGKSVWWWALPEGEDEDGGESEADE